jgi:uncharacterized protein YndB with AHSA1/START domain
MSITSIDVDHGNLSITVVAEFESSIDRVWELWSDPRKLEGWWGPPGYPATFEQHDLMPGGQATYFMSGPEGEKHWGVWRVTAVDPPSSLEFLDAFAEEGGTPKADMPTHKVTVLLTESDGRTRMEMVSKLHSREDMEALERMGAVEGLREAVGQMDGLLAA